MIKIEMNESEPIKCGNGEIGRCDGFVHVVGKRDLCVLELAAVFEELIKGDYDGIFYKALNMALEHIELDKK